MSLLGEISIALENGESEKMKLLVERALKDFSPEMILNDSLMTGMNRVGERFSKHEIFLPDVLLCAKAMQNGLEVLKPYFSKEGMPNLGKVVIGTVQGDLHDIGKNLVGVMLKGSGFEVIDLGKGVSPEKFIDVATKENAKVIGMSALLTTTMLVMREVVDIIRRNNLKIKTIIGGAPVSQEFANQIGADAYAYDASSGVTKVKTLFS